MRTVYDRIVDMRGNLITVMAKGVGLGEMALIEKANGSVSHGSVIRFEGDKVTLQVFGGSRGISTNDKVIFLNKLAEVSYGKGVLGRVFNGMCEQIDECGEVYSDKVEIGGCSWNPIGRIVPHELVRTNIPMIDVFNCLVKSQKIPIFSVAGEPYNKLLMRIANQTDADVVIIGCMGVTFSDYNDFLENARSSGRADSTVMFVHRAVDPPAECILVPDMALACAERFIMEEGKNVLVLLTDMTAFADALKEISISMDQVPSNRGYPGSLYSDLAFRYEKAVASEKQGSITIVSVTTMPGNDVTHPVPDNTGFITEGQFYLNNGVINPFGSLSRLKQLVIGKVTREDHGDLANALIRFYAESKKAQERRGMGFKLSTWDEKLLKFSIMFESELMSLEVNKTLEEALDIGWRILFSCFEKEELGIKSSLVEKYHGLLAIEKNEKN